jgi:radical SAM superfamily enzyme YgiQ (UPF0313 family)
LAGDIQIIAGGPFVYSSYLLYRRISDNTYDTASPAENYLFLTKNQCPDVDFFIVDTKGKWILSEALNRIKAGRVVSGLPNIAYWDGQAYVFSARSSSPSYNNDFSIDWSVVPDRFFKFGAMNVQASHGCPYRCEFCNFVKEKKDMYVKPLDLLISELVNVSKRGIKYVRFVDDNFRLGRNDLNDFCKAIIRGGLNIQWMSFIRANALHDSDLELLKKAGCIEVQMGVESADREVLKNMNKQSDPKMYSRVIGDLLDIGINCSCCFQIGFPGETAKSLQTTLDFIENIPKSTHSGSFCWSLYPFLLVPLSPIYEPAKRAKYALSGYLDKWEHFSMNSNEAHTCIRRAFCEIKNSGPIYSGDNLEMMFALSSAKRKEFINARHSLEKKFLEGPQDKSVVIDAFSGILSALPTENAIVHDLSYFQVDKM